MRRPLAALLLLLLAAAAPAAPPATQPATRPATTIHQTGGLLVATQSSGAVLIDGTLEASMDYLRVQVQLQSNGVALTAESTGPGLEAFTNLRDINDLDALFDGKKQAGKRDDRFVAFLDTGASANVLSKRTAGRFSVREEPGAVFHEVGLHGETAMGVTLPMDYLVATLTKNDGLVRAGEGARFQVSRADANPMVEMLMGEVNIIGMPAIRRFVVRVDTGGRSAGLERELENLDITDLQKPEVMAKLEAAEAGPSVRLHPAGFDVGETDLTVPLTMRDFSRRKNPLDKGPHPDLAENPCIVATAHLGEQKFTGLWLLDTGAPANIISTAQAKALGLLDEQGRPTRDADFELPLGGIGGRVEPVAGYRIDRLVIPAQGGKSLDYRRVFVLVNDITVKLDSGETVTLDGVMGTGLWLPTVAGVSSGFPTQGAPSAFSTFWIDTGKKQLRFTLAKPEAAKK